MWLGADVVGVAAVAQRQIQVAVRAKGDRAAVVIVRVLAERDDLAARGGIDDVRVGRAHLPLVDHVLVVLRRAVGRDVGRRRPGRNRLAVVGVERAESRGWRVR